MAAPPTRSNNALDPSHLPAYKTPMNLLTQLCSIPTAPFVEHRVVDFAKRFAADRNLRVSTDTAGNLLLELRTKSRLPRWVFAAHMDHPGMVARRMIDATTLEADFRGFVVAQLMTNVAVRFFVGEEEIRGTIIEAIPEKKGPRAQRVRVKVRKEIPAGACGMFDLGEGRVKGKLFYSRVCDDLAGAAGALAMLEALAKKPPESPVAVLLTRAEEEGFIGAIAAVRERSLLRETDRLVAIECSAVQPAAPQGLGPIIRVGDRTSIFNSALTYFLTQQAETLAKKDKSFGFQRALMPGGTCEATVYDIYGYLSSSICVALGNYHNMNREKKTIGPEYIDVSDWQNMVKLFIHLARTGHEYAPGFTALKARIEKRFEELVPFLYPPTH